MRVAFDDWLREIAANCDHPFVRDSEQMVAYCDQLSRDIPETYGWRFADVAAIREQSDAVHTPVEAHRIYWLDHARTAEAYAVMSFWRASELLENAVVVLNQKDLVAAAVLCRSGMEVAATFINNANKIAGFFNDVTFPADAVVVSDEFENLVVKAIWGTRLGDPEPAYFQPNALNVIQKLSKRPEARDLLPMYEYLCELAHPNVIGNLRFWSGVDRANDDGSEIRRLHRRHVSNLAPEIVERILWSLGWSGVCTANAFRICQTGVETLVRKLS